MDQENMTARCERWFAQIADLQMEINRYAERAVRSDTGPSPEGYHSFGQLIEALAQAMDHLSEVMEMETEAQPVAEPAETNDWMMPDVVDIYVMRERTGEGLHVCKHKLIQHRVKDAMPAIIADKDFTRLAHIVDYLISKGN